MRVSAIASLFLLVVAACGRSDDLIGNWDCQVPIGSSAFSFHEDSSFVWRTKFWFVKSAVAGQWHHRGDEVNLEIQSAPPESGLAPGDTQALEILTLNQSLFVSKDGTGEIMTCTRQDASDAPQE
jgi:hypothetical protein